MFASVAADWLHCERLQGLVASDRGLNAMQNCHVLAIIGQNKGLQTKPSISRFDLRRVNCSGSLNPTVLSESHGKTSDTN
jgi:hypothetical protein